MLLKPFTNGNIYKAIGLDIFQDAVGDSSAEKSVDPKENAPEAKTVQRYGYITSVKVCFQRF